MQRISVFCGSSLGYHPRFLAAAWELGKALADDGIGLVRGGTSTGLTDALADAVLARGGEVIRVIVDTPRRITGAQSRREELRVVGSPSERKAMIAELSDGFIALPGGSGTLEELFEVWAKSHLGHHAKPCGLLNVGGFYDGLMDFLDLVTAEGFMKITNRNTLTVSDRADNLLERLKIQETPFTSKWHEANPIRHRVIDAATGYPQQPIEHQ